MKTLLSCEFNMDAGCVELRYSDGSMISIDCTAVEDEVANSCKNRHPSPICTQFEHHFHALKPHLLCHSF